MDQENKKNIYLCKTGHFPTSAALALQMRVTKFMETFPLLQEQHTLVIAVSGGSDSLCLLHLIAILLPKTRLVTVYVDHGLRPSETDVECRLVMENAATCGATFRMLSVDVDSYKQKYHLSMEEAARILRYQELEKIRIEFQATFIAVGHTADDQAEEVLLRLIRGSGCNGLSAMKAQGKTIIRPLLQETKKSLRHWLYTHHIQFCEDSSNSDPRFLRNRIRQDLLPKLEKDYNPAIRKTLLRTASILRADDQLLQELTEDAYQNSTQLNYTDSSVSSLPESLLLDLALFNEKPLALQRRVLEKICFTMQGQPSFQKIKSLLNLCTNTSGGEIHLTNGLRAEKLESGVLFSYPLGKTPHRKSVKKKADFLAVTINNTGSHRVPELHQELLIQIISSFPPHPSADQLFIDPQTISFPLILRSPQPGDIFHPLGAPGKKKVARFLSDQKIPRFRRGYQPVLVSENRILALPGLRIDHSVRVQSNTRAIWLLEWRPLSLSNSL